MHDTLDNPPSPQPTASSHQPNGSATHDNADTAPQADEQNALANAHGSDSARPNGEPHDASSEATHGGPPVKRRKTMDTRARSPPWKKQAVEGPTSFTLNGKRVSARTNVVPLELQPPSDKRTTRAAIHQSAGGPRSRYAGGAIANPSPASSPVTPAPAAKNKGGHAHSRSVSNVQGSPTKSSPRNRSQPLQHTPSTVNTSSPYGKRVRRPSYKLKADRTPSPPPPSKSVSPETKRRPGRPRKHPLVTPEDVKRPAEDMSEADDEHDDHMGDQHNDSLLQSSPSRPGGRPQRLKFKVMAPTLTATNPSNMTRPKQFPSFRDWVTQTNPFDNPTEGALTDHQVQQQASLRNRIHRAAQPGGLLTEAQCTVFQPEAEAEPDRQWAHHDRLLRHFEHFRRLLERERNRHRAEARKLAHDCLARWRELQPAPVETAEDFAARRSEAVMRQCLRDLEKKCEMLRREVLEWRVQQYQEQLEIQERKELGLLVNRSENILALTYGKSAETSEEEQETGEESGEHEGSSVEENMSSDGGSVEEVMDGDDAEDDKLSAEALKRKYNPERRERAESNDAPMVNGHAPDEAPSPSRTCRRSRGKLPLAAPGDPEPSPGHEAVEGADDEDESSIASDDGEDESTEQSASEEQYDDDTDDDDGDDEGSAPGTKLALLAMFSKEQRAKVEEQAREEALRKALAEAPEQKDDVDPIVNGFSEEPKPTLLDPATDGPIVDASMDLDKPIIPSRTVQKLHVPNAIISPDDSMEDRNGHSSPLYPAPLHDLHEGDGEDEEVSLIDVGFSDPPQVQTPPASISEPMHVDVPERVNGVVPHEQPVLSGESAPQIPDEAPVEDLIVDDEVAEKAAPETMSPEPIAPEVVDSKEQLVEGTAAEEAPTPEEPTPEDSKSSEGTTSDKDVFHDAQTDATSVEIKVPAQSDQGKDTAAPASPVSAHGFKTPVPSLLRGTLREYQHHGLDWMAGLYKQRVEINGPGGILADEMGLGKTIQTIALLAHVAERHEVWGPHLIIVPSSVLMNWEMEFKKFLPGFKVLTYYGNASERQKKRQGWNNTEKWDVVIASYSSVHSDHGSFKRKRWHYMVLDEAHHIKNWQSQKWQNMITFKAYRRLLLTGTPLQNHIGELWSLLTFLDPPDAATGASAMPGLQAFRTMFSGPIKQIMEQGRTVLDENGKELVRQLHQILRPFILRRLKANVEKQMPRKYEHVVYCKLSRRQRYLYDGFMSRTETKATLASGNYMSIINCLMQLRKVCNHPDLFETRPIVTSFAMSKSAIADFETKELLVRRRLLQDHDDRLVNLDVINMLPGSNGPMSALDTIQSSRLGALGRLRQLAYRPYAWSHMPLDGSSVSSTLAWYENERRFRAYADLDHRAYLTSLRSQRRPLFSYFWAERLQASLKILPHKPKPQRRAEWSDWFWSLSPAMHDIAKTLPNRSELMEPFMKHFSCVTPAVVAPRMADFALSSSVVEDVKDMEVRDAKDAFHEARMRLSIAFPDKRLLQWDCGKLQKLALLLRDLQAGGHRALIFTQMTRVLDILEQFLNIHGHRYLRLDGSTKVDQRHVLTERFNHDPRILCFILSSRSGGLGINLTGADTVIFYDLDWNPAMDKQCQDRCHRIGQTRDVHVYRLVSEHTVEANILRKSDQKRHLDDVIIQDGDFTTDYLTRSHPAETFAEVEELPADEIEADGAAIVNRALGAGSRPPPTALQQAEETEDAQAARVAAGEAKENLDDGDFDDQDADAGNPGAATDGGTDGASKAPAANGAPASSQPAEAVSDTAKLSRNAASAAGADPTSETYRRGTVALLSEAQGIVFKGSDPIGVDRHLMDIAIKETADIDVADLLERAGMKAKRKKKKGPEHILAKKKDY